MYIFTAFWDAITLFILCTLIKTGITEPAVYIFMSIFVILGIIFTIIDIRKILYKLAIENHGEIVYGFIYDLKESNLYINDKQQLEAKVVTYVESEDKIEILTMVDGLDDPLYEKNATVKMKYYKGKAKFIEEVLLIESIPMNVRNAIEKYLKENH